MPPLPDAASCLRIDYTFTVGEDLKAKCREYMDFSGSSPSSSELNTFAAAITTSFGANLKSLMTVDYELSKVEVTDLTSPTANVGEDTTGATGTRAGDTLSAADCMLVSKTVLRRYRGGHPRMYWPFGVQADLDTQQEWTDAFVTATNTGVTNHDSTVDGAGWAGAGTLRHVNISYYEGFTVFTGPTGRARNISTVRSSPVIDHVVGNVARKGVATQRKRLLHLA